MLNKRIIRHCIFWVVCLLALTDFYMGPEYDKIFKILLLFITAMPVFVGYSYLSMYVVIPAAFRSERFWLLIGYFIVASIGFAILYRICINFFYYRFFDPSHFQQTHYLNYRSIANNMVAVNMPFLMFAAAKLIRDYLMEMNKKSDIENKNMEAELSLLAAQLHPHFLFNTLNNLYSLSLSGSPKTATSLQKIKGLMNYILYECGQPEISIKKEINLIDNYIELEKLRYDKKLNVSFTVDIQENDFMIAPMILFTFVENCFKHGSSKLVGNSYIRIKLSSQGNNMTFETENSIPTAARSIKHENQGLGLENVKKRLAFLYPDHHTLIINPEENRFSVELKIEKLSAIK
jgi:two-component system, LytTR family, sensor kinase